MLSKMIERKVNDQISLRLEGHRVKIYLGNKLLKKGTSELNNEIYQKYMQENIKIPDTIEEST